MHNNSLDDHVVFDMQDKLIIDKTEEFLDMIKYNGVGRKYIKQLVIALSSAFIKDFFITDTSSIYNLLKLSLKKSKTTIVNESKPYLQEMLSNNETVKILRSYGFSNDITLSKFLKFSLVVIKTQVDNERRKNENWI